MNYTLGHLYFFNVGPEKKGLGSEFYLQFGLDYLPKMFTKRFIRGLDNVL